MVLSTTKTAAGVRRVRDDAACALAHSPRWEPRRPSGSMALVATPASAASLTLVTPPMRVGPPMGQSVTMTAAYPTAFSVLAYITVWDTTDATQIAGCGTGVTTCVASFTNDNPSTNVFVAYVVRAFGFPGQSTILATADALSIS